jgi:hypothetical protein
LLFGIYVPDITPNLLLNPAASWSPTLKP